MARTIHLLNSLGHVTVHWEEQNDSRILPAIQSMLDRGFTFFILNDDGSQATIGSMDEIVTVRRVVLTDEELEHLHAAGLLEVGGVIIDEDVETTGDVARTAEEVTAHDTVVTQPARGG